MSSVSRSVYQKKCEECKKLLDDIRMLVQWDASYEEYVSVFKKYKARFIKETKLDDDVSGMYRYYKQNPYPNSKK